VTALDQQFSHITVEFGRKRSAPTRVTYALAMPTMSVRSRGPSPEPVQAPPATGFDEVTKGYVP